MALLLVGVISSAQADANSDSATGIADGLRSFADRLDDSADALGDYQALAQSLPLVELAPGSADALRLSTLLQEQLTAGSNALDATYNTLGELESDLEALDELQDGVQFTVAVTLVAELGDLTRFDHPSQLMNYLGLTPSESSSGERRRQGAITKSGNTHARRVWVEVTWAYRYPAKVSCHLQLRLEKPPKGLQDLS